LYKILHFTLSFNLVNSLNTKVGNLNTVGVGKRSSVGNSKRSRVGDSKRSGVGNSNRGSNSTGHCLDSVGASFMNNRLMNSLVGSHRSSDRNLSMDGDVLEDRLGSMMRPNNRGRLVSSNGSRNMSVDGLRNRMGKS